MSKKLTSFSKIAVEDVLETCADMPVIVSSEGYFTTFSKNWIEILGWPEDHLKNTPFLEFVHPEDLEATKTALEKMSQGLRVVGFINRYKTATGGYKTLQWNTSLPDEEGYCFCSAKDITEELRQKASITDKEQELNHFIFMISHDLKEPIRKVQGFASIIEEEMREGCNKVCENSAKISGYLKKLISASERMDALILSILSLSQLSVSKQEHLPLSLTEILDSILEDYGTIFEQEFISITIGELPPLVGSKIQIRELFQNLISNSIKFRKKTGILEISIYMDGPVLIYEDNGIGFDNKYNKEIFNMFKRLHGKEYPGTGTGLAICKKIMESHGGTIIAEGDPNLGARFILDFNIGNTDRNNIPKEA